MLRSKLLIAAGLLLSSEVIAGPRHFDYPPVMVSGPPPEPDSRGLTATHLVAVARQLDPCQVPGKGAGWRRMDDQPVRAELGRYTIREPRLPQLLPDPACLDESERTRRLRLARQAFLNPKRR